ncbi:MAG: hypothetical protein MJA82_05095 [Clostridia bacterium]|nr:hypothetical protein [Clostridia bacterium]
MHQLIVLSGSVETDITPLVGDIKWRSSINELGEQLDFNIIFNDGRYFPSNPIDLGSVVKLKNGSEIFQGVVVTEEKNGREAIGYTSFDYAFYLNKSKEVYQFNGVLAKKAIETVLRNSKITIGNIVDIPIVVKKIYNHMTVGDIIKDIIKTAEDERGNKYRLEMRQGRLYIENQKDLVIEPTFKFADNIQPYDVTKSISNPRRKRTIENMKNSIKIVANGKVLYEARNNGLISRYGLLQEIVSADGKDSAQGRNIANNILKEQGRVFEENSVEMIGSDEVRAGRIIRIEEPLTGMVGQYLVNDVTHTLRNGIHRMQVGLGVI